MDPSVIAAEEPTGFTGWIMQNGQVVAFVAQLAYWLLIILALVAFVILAFRAVREFKRWVDFQTGVTPELPAGKAPEKADAVAVEEFVD